MMMLLGPLVIEPYSSKLRFDVVVDGPNPLSRCEGSVDTIEDASVE